MGIGHLNNILSEYLAFKSPYSESCCTTGKKLKLGTYLDHYDKNYENTVGFELPKNLNYELLPAGYSDVWY